MVNLLSEFDNLEDAINAASRQVRSATQEERHELLLMLVPLRARQESVRRLINSGKLTASEAEVQKEAEFEA
jgi:hypothetical protein